MWALVVSSFPDHPIDQSTLGEYAAVQMTQGMPAAQRAFPDVAQHLAAGCNVCAGHLDEMTALLKEEQDVQTVATGLLQEALNGLRTALQDLGALRSEIGGIAARLNPPNLLSAYSAFALHEEAVVEVQHLRAQLGQMGEQLHHYQQLRAETEELRLQVQQREELLRQAQAELQAAHRMGQGTKAMPLPSRSSAPVELPVDTLANAIRVLEYQFPDRPSVILRLILPGELVIAQLLPAWPTRPRAREENLGGWRIRIEAPRQSLTGVTDHDGVALLGKARIDAELQRSEAEIQAPLA